MGKCRFCTGVAGKPPARLPAWPGPADHWRGATSTGLLASNLRERSDAKSVYQRRTDYARADPPPACGLARLDAQAAPCARSRWAAAALLRAAVFRRPSGGLGAQFGAGHSRDQLA